MSKCYMHNSRIDFFFVNKDYSFTREAFIGKIFRYILQLLKLTLSGVYFESISINKQTQKNLQDKHSLEKI